MDDELQGEPKTLNILGYVITILGLVAMLGYAQKRYDIVGGIRTWAQIKPGIYCTNPSQAYGFDDFKVYYKYGLLQRVNDESGIQDLAKKGGLFLVEPNTKLFVLQRSSGLRFVRYTNQDNKTYEFWIQAIDLKPLQ